ncbi:hypothetical protein [Pseudoalteromonas sp. H105]|uniref:hypothetical protein n=1 Tax=Pseudoalteromonas sp. H105 TaxID=1348393 RepID=UPI00073218C7|nr:hypothetical protein [Pseudoalteromonas sp. H105]KTF12228.1 hypothetical protein ATS75_18480 [Pseudoalteromonas sp. H105]
MLEQEEKTQKLIRGASLMLKAICHSRDKETKVSRSDLLVLELLTYYPMYSNLSYTIFDINQIEFTEYYKSEYKSEISQGNLSRSLSRLLKHGLLTKTEDNKYYISLFKHFSKK